MVASACFWVSIRLLYVLFMVCFSVVSHIFILSVLAVKKRSRYSILVLGPYWLGTRQLLWIVSLQ